MRIDPNRLSLRLAETMAKHIKPLHERLDAVEARTPERGEKGEPGQGVTADEVIAALGPVIEAQVARHLLDLERRAADMIQRAIDRIPAPQMGPPGPPGEQGPAGPRGERGADGLGFDDLDFEARDDGRTLVFRLVRGDEIKEAEMQVPVVLYRGIYHEEATYDAGDAVTWGGSLWIALRRTSAKPGDGSTDWRLAVKKGRDGRDSK